MNSKWYWLIRQKYRNLKFQIKKAAFRLNERKESSERLSSFSRMHYLRNFYSTSNPMSLV